MTIMTQQMYLRMMMDLYNRGCRIFVFDVLEGSIDKIIRWDVLVT